jgi:predicted P-loop ATPase
MEYDDETAQANLHQSSTDMRPAAQNYRNRGWAPLPLRPNNKAPIAKNWTQLVVDDDTDWPGNVGVRLGAPSGGVVDMDLDCEEALLLASAVLPRTGTIFGRPGSPRAHWFFDCGESAPETATTGARFAPRFGEHKDKPLLEVRSTGGQTMVPPSVHPNGERLEWVEFSEPAKIGPGELMRSAGTLAAASLLLRHFPDEGMRFDAYGALIGTMLRCEVSADMVAEIVRVFTDRFGSPARARKQSVHALAKRLESGDGTVPGFPRLAEVFGRDVARRCREWLQSDTDWHRNKSGAIVSASLHNMRLAMSRLDVRLRHDEFADQPLVSIGEGKEEKLLDPIVHRLRYTVEEECGFRPPIEEFWIFIADLAWHSRFHPVRDYLDSLKWDGRKRIDTWLFDYGGVARRGDDHDKYIEAVGRITLVAAVQRVRQPGCKFDEMLVLISETQGTDKSTALATLAVAPDWFSDSIDLGMKDKEIIEQMQGKWIAEIPELRGRRNEVDRIKAFLSRQHDRARLAYGRLRTEVGRSFVMFGTANDARFLLDRTGNRRFWPVVSATFDIEALKRDRDQLWAEAAAAQAAGESIRLPRELWAAAEAVQAESLIEDPWVETIRNALGDWRGKIRGSDIWNILGIEAGRRRQTDNERMARQ